MNSEGLPKRFAVDRADGKLKAIAEYEKELD